MRKLDEKWGDRGLRVVTAYTQFHELETIEKAVEDIGLGYPVALDGFFASRFTAPLLCQVWVIGPDGKVAWTGVQGWEEAAVKELLKLEYAGLEIKDAEPAVKPAAKAFARGDFPKAYKLADEIAFGDYGDKAIAQAESITGIIEDRVSTLVNRTSVYEIDGRFDKVIACLEELRKYAGLEDVPDVDAEIKRVRELDSYDTETAARRAYIIKRLEVWRAFQGIEDTKEATIKAATDARDALRKFAAGHKGTAVARDATAFSENYDTWINELKGEEADGE